MPSEIPLTRIQALLTHAAGERLWGEVTIRYKDGAVVHVSQTREFTPTNPPPTVSRHPAKETP